MWVVGILAFALSAAISTLVRQPVPAGHDEFSYLLAADTFAHARLSNPPHPLWIHFESFHILQQPSYASKYPPGQGLMLAVGQVLFREPLAGIWVTHALACVATYWMLLAWTRPRWALFGGLLMVIHPLMLYWSQRFMGGGLAVAGGAILLGAVRRSCRLPRRRDAVWLGLGMIVLAISRPYEGAALSILSLMLIAAHLPKHGWKIISPPLLIVLTAGAAWMGYYNWRVTGKPLRLPYLLHEEQYGIAPIFLWQSPRIEPQYRHAVLREFHRDTEWINYIYQQNLQGLLKAAGRKLRVLIRSALPVFILGLPAGLDVMLLVACLPVIIRDHWMRWAVAILIGFTIALLIETWGNPHYAAPAASLMAILIIHSLRCLRAWRPHGRPAGPLIVRVVLILAIAALVPTIAQIEQIDVAKAWPFERARIMAELNRDVQRHLIIVHYGPNHSAHDEWVYNEADIDKAKVVWAREMDTAQNRKLLDYFHDRRVWFLDADANPCRLVPFAAPPDL